MVNVLLSDSQTAEAVAAILINFPRAKVEEEAIEEVTLKPANLNPPLKIPFKKPKLKYLLVGIALLVILGSVGVFIKSDPLNLKKDPLQTEQTTLNVGSSNEIKDWPLYLNLELIKEGFSSKRISFSVGKLLLLDETKKTLVLVDLSQKTNQILAGQDQLGDAKLASLNGDFGFIFSDKEVLRVDINSQKTTVAVAPDEWGEIVDIFGFASNIYLLDKSNNQIWKYLPIEGGYSDKNSYLKERIDLSNASRMLIDASIWVLKQNEILKFTQGVSDNFSVSGLDVPIANISLFYVDDTSDNLYVIDSTTGRLIVLTKTGQFIKEYSGEKFKSADDFIVEEGKKVYLLENNNIYSFELK